MSVDAEDVLTLAEEESSPDAPLPESEPQPANKSAAANTAPNVRKDLFISIPQKLSPMPTIYLSARQKRISAFVIKSKHGAAKPQNKVRRERPPRKTITYFARSERPDLLGGEPRAFGDDPERHPAFEQGFRRAAEPRTYAPFAPFFAESDAFPARRVDDAVAVPAFLLFLCEHEPFLLR